MFGNQRIAEQREAFEAMAAREHFGNGEMSLDLSENNLLQATGL